MRRCHALHLYFFDQEFSGGHHAKGKRYPRVRASGRLPGILCLRAPRRLSAADHSTRYSQGCFGPPNRPANQWTFGPNLAAATSPACDLVGVDLQKATEGNPVETFSLLTGKSATEAKARTQILVKLPHMAVDADGAVRAYHPADPTGRSVCEKVDPGERGDLARDLRTRSHRQCRSQNFQGHRRSTPPSRVPTERTRRCIEQNTTSKIRSTESTWRKFWPLAAAGKVAKANIPSDQVVLYSSQQNVSALFKTKIFPFKGDLPCVQGSRDPAPGYFVSQTAPLKTDHSSSNQCDTSQYRESTQIPYFVIPEGLFDNICGRRRRDRLCKNR